MVNLQLQLLLHLILHDIYYVNTVLAPPTHPILPYQCQHRTKDTSYITAVRILDLA